MASNWGRHFVRAPPDMAPAGGGLSVFFFFSFAYPSLLFYFSFYFYFFANPKKVIAQKTA